MNQILSTQKPQNKKQKHNAPAKISSVIRVFAVVLIFFAIFLIGSGTYAIYKNQNEIDKAVIKPTITLENETESTILLKVISENNIDTVTYYWNGSEEKVINGDGKKYIEQRIDIKTGSNILTVVARDVNGGETSYSNQYTLNSNINIESLDNGKIKITYEGDKLISYMTYRWDEEAETTVDINNTIVDEEIDVRAGIHTLTVILVDEENNTETKVQEINGVSTPIIDISFNEDYTKYVIKLTDQIGLQEVVITLNEDENQRFGQKLSGTEFEFEIPLYEGSDNKMQVTVTNSSNIEAERRVQYPK